MPYGWRVLFAALGAVFWPPTWWQRFAHFALAVATYFAPEWHQFITEMLANFGIGGVEDWHYYAAAAIIAIGLLALRIGLLTTQKVRFTNLRFIPFEGKNYCKLEITNATAQHLMLVAEIRLRKRSGDYLAVDGRDRFVLLTGQRLAERRKLPKKTPERRRFNLGDTESKDLEIITIADDLSKAWIFDELGQIEIPVDDYAIEVSVSGGGPAVRCALEFADQHEIGHVELSARLSMRQGTKRLYFNSPASQIA